MKLKKLTALLLAVTLISSVAVFTPAVTPVAAEKLTLSLLPEADTYISFDAGAGNANYGDKTTLEIGYHTSNPLPVDTGYSGGETRGELKYARDILMRFSLSQLEEKGLDASAVSSAVLRFTVSDVRNNFGTQDNQVTAVNLSAYETDSSWGENSVTKDNAPKAGALAAISAPILSGEVAVGKTVSVDLTSYIRQNPKSEYSFIIKISGCGLDFHSKESGERVARPVLEISADSQLSTAEYYSGAVLEDTYAENSEVNRGKVLDGTGELTVAGTTEAYYVRNGYVKIQLPESSDKVHYDSVKLNLHASGIDNNVSQTVSLVPVDNNWSAKSLTWDNKPAERGAAAGSFVVPTKLKEDPNALRMIKNAVDIADYVNANPNEDGIYSFALVGDRTVTHICASEYVVQHKVKDENDNYHTYDAPEAENALYRPSFECLYREKAALTLHYADRGLNDIASPMELSLPVGTEYTPENIPAAINESYYSSQATNAVNPLPYKVKAGKNDVYLIYENKSAAGYEQISVITAQYEPPVLPENITLNFNDGSAESFPVSWNTVSADMYNAAGSFTVLGTLQGIEYDNVEAEVTVLGIEGIVVPTISTAPGSYPALPATLDVNLDDGSTRSAEVEWDAVAADSYSEVGSFVVNGSLFGGNMTIQLTVLVEAGEANDRPAVADTYTEKSSPTTPHNEAQLKISGVTSGNAASANTDRAAFLRFEGRDFGEVYHDPERNADIDPIVSAKLRLYFEKVDNPATVTYKVYGILPENDTWQEASLTWNSSESVIKNAVYVSSYSVRAPITETWLELDVTDFVREHRDERYLAFYVESDLCAAYISSRESGKNGPQLRTYGYIPDANVTLRYMAEVNGRETDIYEPLALKGKLGYSYEYQSAVPNPIYYPKADEEGIYYYDFVTTPIPPEEGERDEKLYLDSLTDGYNEIVAHYTRRDIVSIETVTAETFRGTKPVLPDMVTAYLDNDTPITESVVWDWSALDFTDYSEKGLLILEGDIEHSDIRAIAEITIHEAYYDEPSYPTMNEFGLESGAAYRLSFTLRGTDTLGESLADVLIKSQSGSSYAYDMTPEAFLEYLSSFEEGDRVDVYFTAPAGEAGLTLSLPDCVNHMTDAELRQVLGRGGDMTLHYMYGGEEVYSAPVNIAYGEAFSLSEEDFTVPGGAYTVTGIDAARSDLETLTGSVVLGDGEYSAWLLCDYNQVFTAETSVENVSDGSTPYTRSSATLFNGTDTDRKVTLIVGHYNEAGKLITVETKEITVPAHSGGAIEEYINTPVKEGYTTVLLWNDILGLMPFLPKVDSRNPTGRSKRPETGDYILVPAVRSSVSPSSEQSGNEAVNMLNRDSGSRWSAQAVGGEPVYADVDLGALHDLHTVGLGFYNGKSRTSRFAIEVSEDGDIWTEVVSPRYSSGKTSAVEYFTFLPVLARYVRVKGYGWKANEITNEGLVERSDEWFSVTAFEAYGPMNDDGVRFSETADFEGKTGKLTTTAPSGGWGADALNEMTYTDYNPSTGSALYADYAKTPSGVGFAEGNTALRLYDNVARDGSSATGAGSVGAFHRLELPSDKYTVRFKWFVPNTIEGSTYNSQWSGVTLSAGRVSGGADTSHPVALQLRLAPSGKNKMAFNLMRSITYNEGDQVSFLGSGTAFNANCVWDVRLDVDALSNTVVVTVSDGTRTESQIMRYGLFNAERTMSQTWNNSSVNYIMFNTGAGGKCEMYVDDFQVYAEPVNEADEGIVTYSEDFESFDNNTEIPAKGLNGIFADVIKEDQERWGYTPSRGSKLGVNIANSTRTGGKALRLYDSVGRKTSASDGAGGMFAYVDIGDISTTSVTKIRFDMYAATSSEYTGFSLGRGHNSGEGDTTNPLALQVRFSPQGEGMQFNMNNSIQYNGNGSYSALVGTGNNRLAYNSVWNVELSVNPTLGNVTVKVTDGSIVSTNTVNLSTASGNNNGDWKADWKKNPINTLIFNTSAGNSAELYIDNIRVIDTNTEKNSIAAINGILRLESVYGGQGYFVTHANQAGSRLGVAKNQNPYYNRLVERRGLADPDSVSLELMGRPGYYVVANADWSVNIQQYRDTEEFRRNATFNKVNSLSGYDSKNDFSYQLYRNHELYLRLDGDYIKVDRADSGSSTGMKEACSFHLRNEANNYVSDSFNGTSLSGQWYKGYPWYSNYHNHSAVHRNENVVVSGGRVLLKATKRGDNEWIKNSSGATGYSDSINGGTWKRYVAWTGVISVNSKVYNKGSYIEGSFKQPNSPRGYWTAFWLNGRDSWPPETDMFEYLSSKGTSTWYTATHGGSESAGWQYVGSNLRTQYHTYAIDWGYNYIKMYVNGNLYFNREGTSDVSYQKNMQLILNTGIGAWESEPDGSTRWGEGLECEWIRSYQYY